MSFRSTLLMAGALALVACSPAAAPSPSPSASGAPSASPSSSAACTQPAAKTYPSPPPATGVDPTKTYNAVLHTSDGDVKVRLVPADARMAVANFIFLATDH